MKHVHCISNEMRFGLPNALETPVIGTQKQGSPKEGKTKKSSTIRTLIAAAALAVAAGTASAQTYKAEIPLSFRAGEKLMAPGAYEIRMNLSGSGMNVTLIQNEDNGKAALLLPSRGKDAPKAWKAAGKPVIGFECLEDHCVLRTIWTGESATYRLGGSITPKADREVAEVLVTLVKGE